MTGEQKWKFERVMIIDDSEVDLYIISRIISKNYFGNKLSKYSSATNALKYLKDNQENTDLLPQVIFVDIHMPLMSGFDFMEAYDKLTPGFKRHCQTFIISSTIDPRDISRAEADENIISFREKPITAEFLEGISTEADHA